MQTKQLLRIGGFGALAVAATQVVGNALHPPIPDDTVEAMQVILGTGPWIPVHLIITLSYFLFVPFVIGAAAAFRERPAAVRVAIPLVLIGAGIGVVQIVSHYTIFSGLAERLAADGGLRAITVPMFAVLWNYSVGLEVAHLLAIFVAVALFGLAMLSEPAFRRWVALLGIAAGAVASAGILVGKFVITGRTGDLAFGFGLLPLVVWIVAVGIALLRMQPVLDAAPRLDRTTAPVPAGPTG